MYQPGDYIPARLAEQTHVGHMGGGIMMYGAESDPLEVQLHCHCRGNVRSWHLWDVIGIGRRECAFGIRCPPTQNTYRCQKRERNNRDGRNGTNNEIEVATT